MADAAVSPAEFPVPSLARLGVFGGGGGGAAATERCVTLVTHLDASRLPRLLRQRALWGPSGAVVAAVLCRDAEDEDLRAVAAAHAEAKADGLGPLTLLALRAEHGAGGGGALGTGYPVNAMRNAALDLAETDLVALLDVDMVPGGGFAASLGEDAALYAAVLDACVAKRHAVVLPCLECVGGSAELEHALVSGGKDGAAAALRDGRARPFAGDVFPAGHAPTDFARWAGEAVPYEAEYRDGFEPYVVLSRRLCPGYDARFVGYGRNKCVHAAKLAALGFRFVVWPSAFVVHASHPPSSDWADTLGPERVAGRFDAVMRLYRSALRELQDGRWDAVVPAAPGAPAEEPKSERLGRWSRPSDAPPVGAPPALRLALYELKFDFVPARLQRTAVVGTPASSGVTLCVGLTADRLSRLAAQIAAWAPGPVSAAVLLPRGAGVVSRALVAARLRRMRAASSGRLAAVLLVEPGRRASPPLVPINALRNAAASLAATELIFPLDVDLIPSAGLHARLMKAEDELLVACRERAAFVVPAVEATDERGHAAASVARLEPSEAAKLLLAGDLRPFHSAHYEAGHAPTRTNDWAEATRSGAPSTALHALPVEHAEGYEPFCIVSRLLAPACDERFRGYGYDKVTYVLALAADGFSFAALPGAFVVDQPHPPSPDRVAFGRPGEHGGPLDVPELALAVKGLFERVKREMFLRASAAGGGLRALRPPLAHVPSARNALRASSALFAPDLAREFDDAGPREGEDEESDIEADVGAALPTGVTDSEFWAGLATRRRRRRARALCALCCLAGAGDSGADAEVEPTAVGALAPGASEVPVELRRWRANGWELVAKRGVANVRVGRAAAAEEAVGAFLRVRVPRGTWAPSATAAHGVREGGVAARTGAKGAASGRALAMHCLVRMPAGVDFGRGGTLPGLQLPGPPELRAGFGWREGGAGHVAVRGAPASAARALEPWRLVPGRWHALAIQAAVCDVGVRIRAWVDDAAVLEEEVERDCSGREPLGGAAMLLTAFYGGATPEWAAPATTHIDVAAPEVLACDAE